MCEEKLMCIEIVRHIEDEEFDRIHFLRVATERRKNICWKLISHSSHASKKPEVVSVMLRLYKCKMPFLFSFLKRKEFFFNEIISF